MTTLAREPTMMTPLAVWRGLIAGSARFSALIAPQLALSAAMLGLYHRILFLPVDFAWLHLPLIAAGQGLFFLSVGWATRRMPPHAAARAYAALLWMKGIAINGVYIASTVTNFFWGDNLTMGNLAAAGQHVVGLRLAFGVIVPLVVGAAAILIVGYAVVLQAKGPRLLRLLWWGTGFIASPNTSDDRTSTATRIAAPAMTLFFCVAAAGACTLQLYLHDQLRRDPLFSFWLRIEQRSAAQANPVADSRARNEYPVVREFERKNVFVFIVDCLRADHLGVYGYRRDTTPYLNQLKSDGRLIQVEHGLSVGNDSPQGIFGILAGRYPEKIHPEMFTLYEALRLQGYRTYAIMSGDKTGYGDLRRLYGRQFDVFVDGTTTHETSINDDGLIVRELQRMPDFDGKRPVFMLFHLMSVHEVGVPEERFDIWRPSLFDTSAGILHSLTPEFARNTYDNRVRQADFYLQQILGALETKGYLKTYVAVITGDHGEQLGEHGGYGHTRYLMEEDTHVPILFLDSSPEGFRPGAFASQIDIAPTLLARLGLPLPSSWDGRSLLDSPGRTTAFIVSRRNGEWRGVVRHDGDNFYKYLCYGPHNGEWHERFFDLHSDPREEHDLGTGAPPRLLTEARQMVAEHFHVNIPPNDPGPP